MAHASRHVRRPEKYFDVLPCQTGRRVIEVDFREAGNRSRVKLKHKKIECCIAPNGSIAIRTEMNLPFIMRTQMNKCFSEFKRIRDFSILFIECRKIHKILILNIFIFRTYFFFDNF